MTDLDMLNMRTDMNLSQSLAPPALLSSFFSTHLTSLIFASTVARLASASPSCSCLPPCEDVSMQSTCNQHAISMQSEQRARGAHIAKCLIGTGGITARASSLCYRQALLVSIQSGLYPRDCSRLPQSALLVHGRRKEVRVPQVTPALLLGDGGDDLGDLGLEGGSAH